jgi:hypothetical protein
MQCRNCGTEIADKAIVCFRCGAPTTEAVRKPAALRRSRTPILFFVVAAILLLLALYVGYASESAADPARWQAISGALAGAAVMVAIFGVLRRRK